MMFTIVDSPFRLLIAPKVGHEIQAFPSVQPSSPEIFHPPGLFKVDGSSNTHRFQLFLVSINRIKS